MIDPNTLGGLCLTDSKCQLDGQCGYVLECQEAVKRTQDAEVYYDMDDFVAAQKEEWDEEERGYPG